MSDAMGIKRQKAKPVGRINMTDHSKALALICENGFMTVAQLCEKLDVSESTARRILSRLSGEGLILRVHGGAAPLERKEPEKTGMAARQNLHLREKKMIARKASEIITDGSTLILLGGTNVAELCPFIAHMHLTVITNSFLVFNALQYSTTVSIIFLGGLFNPKEYEVGGFLANQNLQYIRANFLFMGAAAFDEKSGFYTADPAIELYLSCIEISNTICVLADSSKYLSSGVVVTAKPQQVDYLFTDKGLPQKAVQQFKSLGVEVVVAPEEEISEE
jgi:DeoR/GlpR family transcriptional regulator of sugar metabolism